VDTNTLIATYFIEVVLLLYLMVRDKWVFKVHMFFVTHKTLNEYEKLPSYDDMLRGHGFWRWDVNYFLREDYKK